MKHHIPFLIIIYGWAFFLGLFVVDETKYVGHFGMACLFAGAVTNVVQTTAYFIISEFRKNR